MPVCEHCGSTFEVDASKVLRNVMSEYVIESTGKMFGVLNEDAEKLTVKGQTLVRLDVYQAAKKDEEEKKKLSEVKPTTPTGTINKPEGTIATVGKPPEKAVVQS